MSKQKKLVASSVAVMLMGSLVLTGCGSNNNQASTNSAANTTNQSTSNSSNKNSNSSTTNAAANDATTNNATASNTAAEDPVEITMYIANSPVKDMDRVMEAANKIIKENINATLKLVVTDWSSYPQKLNLMISSGEPFDIAFGASWGDLNYFQSASKGAFADMTDLLDKYAPTTKSRVPDSVWNGVKVNGKIYGAVNYQVWGMAGARGIQLRKDLVDKYNFDWKSVKSWNDLTPFFAEVKKGEKSTIPMEAGQLFSGQPVYYNMDSVGDTTVPGWVKYDDKDIKVFNQYETPEFNAYLKTMRDWYKSGYLRKDAATLKDNLPDRKAGKLAAIYTQSFPDDVDMPEGAGAAMMSQADPAAKVYSYQKRFTPAFISASTPSAAVLTIGANSQHKEKAMQLIELLNTNDELFHLIAFGQPNVDYKPVGDRQFELIPDKYNFNYSEWEVGQSYGRMLWDKSTDLTVGDKRLSTIYAADKTAMVSPVMGFVFDSEPVKTQVANVNSVTAELLKGLEVGAIDPDKYLDTYLKKLKDAGADDIIAEKQKQIDAWKAANGK
ncbi:ABC transporter substrate-binding protein [Paenibacillus sp. OV219]|uniref:ABC transporter substrate-binding protein n=1 Tax=Paenibacillus sp. OV219 TaxID=1884377 RepID=UPI0008B0E515|nr:ABC transporter substrate-binding protein [Paenibacillus sp. OV219]SEO89503.1 putative aldouronate transport system substrate-binding protein [Paenibacillus sp. OV219]